MAKRRLDQLLVDKGHAESREQAQRVIRAGLVFLDGERSDKPGRAVNEKGAIEVRGAQCPYVSRGGLKLEGALARFGLMDLTGLRGLDIGASTGGFTDCLLKHGAGHVMAFDVGHGQLHERIARDRRVTAREGINARELTLGDLGGVPAQIATIDVSFISLRIILPVVAGLLARGGCVVALVKPQFEADKKAVGRGGVVRSREVHQRVLQGISEFALTTGWEIGGLCRSPLTGPAGNHEFFLLLRRQRYEIGKGARGWSLRNPRKRSGARDDPAAVGRSRTPFDRGKVVRGKVQSIHGLEPAGLQSAAIHPEPGVQAGDAAVQAAGERSENLHESKAREHAYFEPDRAIAKIVNALDAEPGGAAPQLQGQSLQIAIEQVLDEIYNQMSEWTAESPESAEPKDML